MCPATSRGWDTVRIILLGAPGSGKGTQAAKLAECLRANHIASGDLFREEQAQGTELGLLAKGYMERGELVPNDVTVKLILGRISQAKGALSCILDGFPRNREQAAALDQALADAGGPGIDRVIYIEVSEEELVKRLGGRWTCRAHQHPYHVVNAPPKTPGICDIDGSELYQRPDDNEETARRRLQVYFDQTAPLVEHYRAQGILATVDGERTITDVGKDLVAALQ